MTALHTGPHAGSVLLADLGGLLHDYFMFWEDATPQERLDS
jgi:hypothetical protein